MLHFLICLQTLTENKGAPMAVSQTFEPLLRQNMSSYHGGIRTSHCLTGGLGSFTLLEVPRPGKNRLSMPI